MQPPRIAIRPLQPNVTSSIKPEVHNVLQRCQRTEPRPQGISTQNFVKIGPAVPEICSWTDRQTDTHTYRQTGWSQYSAPLQGRSKKQTVTFYGPQSTLWSSKKEQTQLLIFMRHFLSQMSSCITYETWDTHFTPYSTMALAYLSTVYNKQQPLHFVHIIYSIYKTRHQPSQKWILQCTNKQ